MDLKCKLQQQYAIAVRPEWLETVLAQLRSAHPDFATWPEAQVFEKVFTAFLFSDLNQAGAATLPINTKVFALDEQVASLFSCSSWPTQCPQAMHKQVLEGKFVLQIDEVVNMAAAARER